MREHATVISDDPRAPGGVRIRRVANLGWLLRHLGEVEWVEVEALEDDHWEGFMTASLSGGRRFSCPWASLAVCRSWLLRRKALRGTRCIWRGQEGILPFLFTAKTLMEVLADEKARGD